MRRCSRALASHSRRARNRVSLVGSSSAWGRAGTTLIEVLMSLLVMGVGVVAVASMFPASLLRSIQATQLTTGTILRYNAEAAIDLDPRLLLDPDLNGVAGNEREITNPRQPLRNYLIDPLGVVMSGNTSMGSLRRYAVGRTTEASAATYVTQPDSWVTYGEEFKPESIAADPDVAGGQRIVIPATEISSGRMDLAGLNTLIQGGKVAARVVLFDSLGRLTEARLLPKTATTAIPVNVTDRAVIWADALPNNGRYTTISKARIETLERRYTWMMSVRRGNVSQGQTAITAEVTVAVLFNRSFGPADETVFTMTGDTAAAPNNKPRRFTVTFGTPKPFIKKGGFLLDTENSRWYRVEQVVSSTTTTATIDLDRTPPDLLGQNRTMKTVFLRGVVDVFPFSKTVVAQ